MATCVYDVLVVGGGVVGCAIIHELTLHGYRCILLEKGENLVSGASAGNSAMVHVGVDGSTSRSLEQKCISKSLERLQSFLQHFQIPHRKTSSLMVATEAQQVTALKALYERAQKNGVDGVRFMAADDVKQCEPNLTSSIAGGLFVPGDLVVDSCLVPVTLVHNARRHGALISRSQEVKKASFCESNKVWTVRTENTVFLAKAVINAAGLYGDRIDDICLGQTYFRILPRKGQYVVFEKAAARLLNNMIFPMPSDKGRGVIIFTSVYGNLVIGPTAEDTDEKTDPRIKTSVINELVEYGHKMLPQLKSYRVVGKYAGLRPGTQHSDYQIHPHADRNYVTVGGIRSTGLTACLGIGTHVCDIIKTVLCLEPSSARVETTQSKASCWITGKPSYVLDGAEYTVTHPLIKVGLQEVNSKL